MKSKFPVAFPTRDGGSIHYGMTLRDYFAAHALSGVLSSPKHFLIDGKEIHDALTIAKYAYAMADAMMEERNDYPR